MDSVIGQYQSTVKPMHLEFVEPSKRSAAQFADVCYRQVSLEGVWMIVIERRALL